MHIYICVYIYNSKIIHVYMYMYIWGTICCTYVHNLLENALLLMHCSRQVPKMGFVRASRLPFRDLKHPSLDTESLNLYPKP